jgi:glycosyltransferase involved in cell wall biosynthesis
MFQKIRRSLAARWWRMTSHRALSHHCAQLQEILNHQPASRKMLIFPPGLDWQAQLFQRPQQLARALAALDVLVFYVQPEHSRRFSGRRFSGFKQLEDNLYLAHTPLETFQILDRPWVHAFTWNQAYLMRLPGTRVLYDYVDDLQAFEGRLSDLQQKHRWLLQHARIVLATAQRLYQQVQADRPDALLCPNGVDYERFAPLKDLQPEALPQDLASIRGKDRTTIGYYGALARWLDYDLLRELVSKRKQLSFVLIGPDHDGTLAASGLLASENVHWLGAKPYDQMPRYLQGFDVAMIPFRLNEITHATSPLKLFEYFAGGKPVVATPMQESARYPGVLTASEATGFARQIEHALELRHDPDYLRTIDQVARQNTWQQRARQILDAMGD